MSHLWVGRVCQFFGGHQTPQPGSSIGSGSMQILRVIVPKSPTLTVCTPGDLGRSQTHGPGDLPEQSGQLRSCYKVQNPTLSKAR